MGMRKIVFGAIGGIVFLVIGLVLGLIGGAIIGGNFFTELEFGSVRGYEAAGNIGAILGAMAGVTFGALLGIKLAAKKKK